MSSCLNPLTSPFTCDYFSPHLLFKEFLGFCFADLLLHMKFLLLLLLSFTY